MKQNGVRLYGPSLSDRNPIENLWMILKRKIPKQVLTKRKIGHFRSNANGVTKSYQNWTRKLTVVTKHKRLFTK